MLTRRDLEAIRAIVREELALARGDSDAVPRSHTERFDDDGEPVDDALREMVAADFAWMRGEPGAEERSLRAHARYDAEHSDYWQKRARKAHGKPDGAPVTAEEVFTVRRRDRERRAEAKARRKARGADEVVSLRTPRAASSDGRLLVEVS